MEEKIKMFESRLRDPNGIRPNDQNTPGFSSDQLGSSVIGQCPRIPTLHELRMNCINGTAPQLPPLRKENNPMKANIGTPLTNLKMYGKLPTVVDVPKELLPQAKKVRPVSSDSSENSEAEPLSMPREGNNKKITDFFKTQQVKNQKQAKNQTNLKAEANQSAKETQRTQIVVQTTQEKPATFLRLSVQGRFSQDNNSNSVPLPIMKLQGAGTHSNTLVQGTLNSYSSFQGSLHCSQMEVEEIVSRYKRVSEEYHRILGKSEEMEVKLLEKTDFIEKIVQQMKMEENKLKETKESNNSYKENVRKNVSRMVLQIEANKKRETKIYLMNQKLEIGEYVQQREGTRSVDVWIDGRKVREIKERLENIKSNKELIEKAKKSLKKGKKSVNGGGTGNQMGGEMHLLNWLESNSAMEEETGTGFMTSLKESKDQLQAQLFTLNKEESLLKEEMELLEKEKMKYLQEFKRVYEEERSKYGKPSSDKSKQWPTLNDRYQLVSLLGKGGFSEVYKVEFLLDTKRT